VRRDVFALALRLLLFLVKLTSGEDQFGGDGDEVGLLVFLRLREIPTRYRKLKVPDAHIMAQPNLAGESPLCL
jgi:hypothetical protein